MANERFKIMQLIVLDTDYALAISAVDAERRAALRITHIGTNYGTRSEALPQPMAAIGSILPRSKNMNIFFRDIPLSGLGPGCAF